MFFRLLVLFFTVATIVLSAWSLVGSYKNESYLTNNYLLSFQLSNLNLSAIFELTTNAKRDYIEPQFEVALPHITAAPASKPTPTSPALEKRLDLASLASKYASELEGSGSGVVASLASQYGVATSDVANALSTAGTDAIASKVEAVLATASIPDSIASLASQYTGDVSSLLTDIAGSLNSSELGLSDMYSVGFYGYCKGSLDGEVEEIADLGTLGKQFRNNNVNYTYCSSPKVGYKLDPLELLKHEITEQIENYVNGLSSLTAGLTDSIAAELLAAVSSISYENLGLPGNLKKDLTLLHSLTIAGFALILSGACLAFISLIFQVFGLCCSPENAFLSCCNFILMFFVALVVVIGSALTTGAYLYVRRVVNNNLDEYGVKSYLSVQFYAFSWCAAVSALLFVIFCIIGYCCGCFHSDRRRRRMAPVMRYDHKA